MFTLTTTCLTTKTSFSMQTSIQHHACSQTTTSRSLCRGRFLGMKTKINWNNNHLVHKHNIQFPKGVTNLYMDATSKQQPNYKHIIHILAYINPKYSTRSYQLHKKSLDMKKDNSQTFSQKTSHVRTRPDSTLARTSWHEENYHQACWGFREY